MSEEEALEVMQANPAVLQCGPSLMSLGPAEVKLFATVRGLGNKLLPPEARGAALATLGASILLVVAGSNGRLSPEITLLVDTIRPILGAVLATVFFTALYGSARA